ncbi:MAG: alpha/beta hydrolase [Candidatus Omnitrophica bacterium]|nr:alpha/beta hydrolase [Candidatus Omnitrophota bacterium]
MLKNIIFVICFFVLMAIWFRYFEWRSIFFPAKDLSYTPDTFDLEYEDIFLTTKDGLKIYAWFISANSNMRYTLLFSHGNGGNISHRISKIVMLNKLGLNIFIYDYRGYGKSEGRPSEAGIYLDAQAAYNYLTKEKGISPDNIIAYGESLGSTVSIDLASKVKLKALILEGAFSRGKDMAGEIYPFLPSCFIHTKFDSLSKIKNMTIPKLFIHSSNDEIVPIQLSRKLFDAAPDPKTFTTLGGGHNTSFIDSQNKYIEGISSFIDTFGDP